MRAVVFHEHGSVDKLTLVEDHPHPILGSADVLVRVKACALNHLDIFTREGLPGLDLPLPHVPGSDMAGVVEEVGQQVEHYAVGDRVVVNPGISCGFCEFCLAGEDSLCKQFKILGEHLPGGYAEFAKVPATNLLKLPDHISFEQAASGALSLLTAYRMVIKRGRLRLGEKVGVIGAGGGVSVFAIQLAKLAGAKVFATTSTDQKAEQARSLGADVVLNYTEDPNWWKTLYYETGKRGLDVVVDSVGEATWDKSLRLLRKGGRLVTCGATTGPMGKTNINLIFWNQLEIIGSTMASRSEFREALQLVFDGKINIPVITYPLEKAREAQLLMEEGQQFGKIVLLV